LGPEKNSGQFLLILNNLVVQGGDGVVAGGLGGGDLVLQLRLLVGVFLVVTLEE